MTLIQSSKSYYQILEITKTASAKDIKRSYRQLARKYHPDQAKGISHKAAEERFKKINEAYSVLSDPAKRSRYDRFGKNGLQFGNSTTVRYSTYTSHKSRRQRIDDKLQTKRDFSINNFANELDVKVENLRKILQTMIDKDMVNGKLENGRFVHL